MDENFWLIVIRLSTGRKPRSTADRGPAGTRDFVQLSNPELRRCCQCFHSAAAKRLPIAAEALASPRFTAPLRLYDTRHRSKKNGPVRSQLAAQKTATRSRTSVDLRWGFRQKIKGKRSQGRTQRWRGHSPQQLLKIQAILKVRISLPVDVRLFPSHICQSLQREENVIHQLVRTKTGKQVQCVQKLLRDAAFCCPNQNNPHSLKVFQIALAR